MGTEEMNPVHTGPKDSILRPLRLLPVVCTGILSGCIYGISLETTECTVDFFSLLLFKAIGSENERSRVTPAEMFRDWENRQMEKGCSRQTGAVAVRSPVFCHTVVRRASVRSQEILGLGIMRGQGQPGEETGDRNGERMYHSPHSNLLFQSPIQGKRLYLWVPLPTESGHSTANCPPVGTIHS